MAHGITARRHPTYKAVAKEAARLYNLREQRNDALMTYLGTDEVVTRAKAGVPTGQLLNEAEAKFPRPEPDPELLALAKQAESSGLYRRSGMDLTVRFDKVGKAAWREEFERLGQPVPEELTRPAYRRPW